ncbi:hypothetical protein DPMN_043854, partial [Dreissena polymorpha]
MYKEFQRFKQHVELTFRGPLTSTHANQSAGWLGMWINNQGRELCKTLTFLKEKKTILRLKIDNLFHRAETKKEAVATNFNRKHNPKKKVEEKGNHSI